jgi:hypothetical protein
MSVTDLFCAGDRRRKDVRSAPLFGLDFVEVTDADQRRLEVFFLGRAPRELAMANVRITGGRRIRNVRVVSARVHRQKDPTLDDYLEVEVSQAGDASEYVLSLVKLDDQGRQTDAPMDGFDPHFASVGFTFKAGCPTDLDCRTPQVCPPPPQAAPDINYLAKDYASFRQLLLDRLALTMPQWRERHVPDIGIMLVELLAYVGDGLSYYQDAVATEAYLGTARQRISVRRHARLVSYQMHEGSNTRAWITIAADTDGPLDARQIFFTTPLPGSEDRHVAQVEDLERIPASSYHVFEPLVRDPGAPISIYRAHNEIFFYTWGECACCLPRGATAATLLDAWVPVSNPDQNQGPAAPAKAAAAAAARDDGDGPPGTRRALRLAVDDVLIFEEVLGPATGNPADADPMHRQAVRLTKVTLSADPLYHPYGADYGQPVVEIEWCAEDALTFPLCLSANMPPPDCDCRDHISVARGNVILVDHGRTTHETPLGTVPVGSTTDHCACGCEPPHTDTTPAPFCPELSGRPLTHAQPLPPCGCAGRLLVQDPRQALPEVTLTGTWQTPHGDVVTTWTPVPDLLESGPNDPHFVVEADDEGHAHLRFGDGDLGQMPAAGTVFGATYRVGNGSAGQLGAEAISTIVFRETTGNAGTLIPRNPLPTVGGIDPEAVEEVKAFAPQAFRTTLARAVIADDYATIAADNDRRFAERSALPDRPGLSPNVCPAAPFQLLQGAKATLRWTGAGYQVFVAIDPLGTEEADAALLTEIEAYLERYRRIGHDVAVKQAQYVGLDLALHVCVRPEYLRGHVKAALLDVFSNRTLPDGTRGLFHPDNLTFGEGIYASRLIAAAQAVTGVQFIELTRLARFEIGAPSPGGSSTPGDGVPAHGVLALGPFEIARLDNDPNAPENGRLTLDVGGGR